MYQKVFFSFGQNIVNLSLVTRVKIHDNKQAVELHFQNEVVTMAITPVRVDELLRALDKLAI